MTYKTLNFLGVSKHTEDQIIHTLVKSYHNPEKFVFGYCSDVTISSG